MAIHIINPYTEPGAPWLRGNLHAHTTNSDGARSPQALVTAYAEAGYDFLMLSDHDFHTRVDGLDTKGMVLIPGIEVTDRGCHILHVAAKQQVPPDPDRQAVIDAINSGGSWAIMTHPNWEKHFNHCPQKVLEQLTGYAGLEVCNGVCLAEEGSGYAMDRWDRLLAAGRQVWGFGNDDCHRPNDECISWNMVQCAERTPETVSEAMRCGRHYFSTGIYIDSIEVNGNRISLRTANAQRIAAVSDYGRRPAVTDASTMEFAVPEDASYTYVRFECYGDGERMAWTQPFFLERTDA